MAYPLYSRFRRGFPIAGLPSSWLNWVANFFNTCVWTGFVTNFTSSGNGSTISTSGDTATVKTLQSDDTLEDWAEWDIQKGLVTGFTYEDAP